MGVLKAILCTVNVLSVIVICLVTAIVLPTFHLDFYSNEYKKYHISQNIAIEHQELMLVTAHLLDYMKGEHDALDIEVKVRGNQQAFFNERERAHMVDVKNLILLAFFVRKLALFFFFGTVLSLIALKINFLQILARANQIGLSVFMLLLLILTLIISFDFERSFNIFHELFFNNDLWILNPETDLLIHIVPLPFFIDISTIVAIIFCLFMVAILIGSGFVLRANHHNTYKKNIRSR